MLDWLVKLGGLPELALAVLSLHPVLRTVTGHSLRREELPRRRPPEPAGPPPRSTKEEDESDLQEEEEEEPAQDPPQHPGAEPKRKPPGPGFAGVRDRSPRRSDRTRSAGKSRADRPRRSRRREHRDDRGGRSRKTGTTRRGGRKHQRLYRLAKDPNKVVHRKATAAWLELSSIARGGDALCKGD